MRNKVWLSVGIAVYASCLSVGLAQSPALIHYQGRLVDGTNLVSGTAGLTLRLYDASAAGTLLYADSNAVTVVDGLYATYIGDGTISGNLDTALTYAQVWLEAEVNGATLTPRERLVSVPYARAVPGLRVAVGHSIVLNPDHGTNSIHPDAVYSVIGGGRMNVISPFASFAAISGGVENSIQTNASYASISGGQRWSVQPDPYECGVCDDRRRLVELD